MARRPWHRVFGALALPLTQAVALVPLTQAVALVGAKPVDGHARTREHRKVTRR